MGVFASKHLGSNDSLFFLDDRGNLLYYLNLMIQVWGTSQVIGRIFDDLNLSKLVTNDTRSPWVKGDFY